MKKILLVFLLLTWFGNAVAQTTVKGRVTASDDKSALPGVSVTVKGTTTGTVTNANGEYAIEAPKGADLLFSFVGMASQTIKVGAQSVIDVELGNDASQLNEVVVTALGISREKKSLGYAMQDIKGDQVNTVRQPNFVNSLQGKVAGIEINSNNNLGSSSNVVIRGFKSLTGNNQALFVVDGIPIDNNNTNIRADGQASNVQNGRGGYDYGNAASDINPDNIADISILKGAAATALYGSRASNGVIMITTKKGEANKGIGLSMNLGFTMSTIDESTFPKYQNQYGGGYGLYYEDPSGQFLYRDINGDGVDDLVVPTSEDASYGAKFDATKMVYQWDAFDPASPNYGKARPWVAGANGPRSFFKNQYATNLNVALDGGNANGTYRVSYTNNASDGIMSNAKINKHTFNFGGNYKFTNKLSATTTVNFVRQDAHGRYGNGYSDNIMSSFRQWFQTNVDILEQKEAFERNGQNVTWNWADPTDLKPIYWDNPWWQRANNYESDWRNRIFGNIALDYKFNDALSLTGRVNLDTYNEQQEERFAVGTVGNNGTASYSRYDHTFMETNYDLFLKYYKDFGSNWNLNGLLGSNVRRSDNSSIQAATQGGLVVPGIYSLSNSAQTMSAPAETQWTRYVTGLFANLSVGYKDYLFLEGSIRRDQSSTLPAGHNVYYYPAISGSFIFSNVLKSSVYSFGKFRLNYAEVGNDAPVQSLLDPYVKPTNVNADSRDAFNGQITYQTSVIKRNPDLRPERTKNAEAGLEMKFLKNRLGFDIAVYNALSVDQIMPVAVSKATGYDTKYVNAGTIRNRGIELTLNGTPVQNSNFSWNSSLNFTLNRNLVMKLYDGVNNLQIGSFQGGVTLNATVGQPYGVLRGTDYKYLNGQKVVLASGVYDKVTDQVLGNVNPNYKIGWNNTFKYKTISLSVLLDYQDGGSVFSLDQWYGLATGLYNNTVFLNDKGVDVRQPISAGGGYIYPGVFADGSANTKRISGENYGILGYRRNPNSGFIYDKSYLKLREVVLSMPINTSKIFGNTKVLKSAVFSLTGRNLWIIMKNLPFADPEDGITSGNVQGFQSGVYPALRQFGANLKVTF